MSRLGEDLSFSESASAKPRAPTRARAERALHIEPFVEYRQGALSPLGGRVKAHLVAAAPEYPHLCEWLQERTGARGSRRQGRAAVNNGGAGLALAKFQKRIVSSGA